MTLAERAAAFNADYAKWPAAHLRLVEERGQPVLYGRWLIGNDYRNRSRFYGSYPPGYLARVMALFPDVPRSPGTGRLSLLHAFSGSLPAGDYTRCDLRQDAEIQGNVYDLPAVLTLSGCFALALADPPYAAADAERYGTPPVNRGRALRALAYAVAPGGHLVWLDTCWPMHRKADWRTVGRITLLRSTNHRVREVTIFERAGLVV